MLLYAAEATDFVGDFGVVLETLEEFAAYADGAYGNEVGGVGTCGPSYAGDDVKDLEGACYKLVQGEVESLFLLSVLVHEGGMEGLLQGTVVLLIDGGSRLNVPSASIARSCSRRLILC